MRARRIAGCGALLVALLMVVAACGNASDDKTEPTATTKPSTSSSTSSGGATTTVDQPGVTADEIRVGGVASITNPLNGPYGDVCKGAEAYFDMINSEGGIYGRDLKQVSCRDDQIANNKREVEAAISQDNVFAVMPIATIFSFSGAKVLADQKVPAFGWNLNDEWRGPENLFGNMGALCLGCDGVAVPWLVKQQGAKKVGVLAYNIANSSQCAEGYEKSFKKYPVAKIVFVTKSVGLGTTDFSAEVKQMKDKGVQVVMTCMDQGATLNIAKELRKQELDAIQYLPNAYNQEFVETNAEFFKGGIVNVQFAPFETRPKPAGLAAYDKWIANGDYPKNEASMVGWINAAMLVQGLRDAGPDFTRQKVVDALNTQTDMRLDGLLSGIDWTTQHVERRSPLACSAIVEITDSGTFKPVYGKPGKPYMCFPDNPDKLPTEPVEYR